MSKLTIVTPFTFKSDYQKLDSSQRIPGPIASTTDLNQIYRQRVFAVLTTRQGERVMRPNFGTNLHKVVFETQDSALELANDSIKSGFSLWLKELRLLEVTPKYDPRTGVYEFTVLYALPSGEKDFVKINTEVFNRTGEVIGN